MLYFICTTNHRGNFHFSYLFHNESHNWALHSFSLSFRHGGFIDKLASQFPFSHNHTNHLAHVFHVDLLCIYSFARANKHCTMRKMLHHEPRYYLSPAGQIHRTLTQGPNLRLNALHFAAKFSSSNNHTTTTLGKKNHWFNGGFRSEL